MTKGYCPECTGVMDESDFEFNMCNDCYEKTIPKLMDDVVQRIKYPKLRFKKGKLELFYRCNTVKWNYYLNRYYPNAVLVMDTEELNNSNLN